MGMESEAEYIFNYQMRQMCMNNLMYNVRCTNNGTRVLNNLKPDPVVPQTYTD
jgi:hypothetical protein